MAWLPPTACHLPRLCSAPSASATLSSLWFSRDFEIFANSTYFAWKGSPCFYSGQFCFFKSLPPCPESLFRQVRGFFFSVSSRLKFLGDKGTAFIFLDPWDIEQAFSNMATERMFAEWMSAFSRSPCMILQHLFVILWCLLNDSKFSRRVLWQFGTAKLGKLHTVTKSMRGQCRLDSWCGWDFLVFQWGKLWLRSQSFQNWAACNIKGAKCVRTSLVWNFTQAHA